LKETMLTVIAVLASFVLGAVTDHFLEKRTAAAVTEALEKLGDRMTEEIRKLR